MLATAHARTSMSMAPSAQASMTPAMANMTRGPGSY